MVYSILFYILVVIFVLAIIVSWFTNLFGLPGNWMMVGLILLWSIFVATTTDWHIEIWLGIVFAVIAGIGELIEFAASVLGTKGVGGSKKAATCSVIGSIVGGIVGGIFGLPIPIPLVGMIIGSVLFACVGAMVGAMIGEKWQGAQFEKSLKVGGAAAAGRFVGTMSKIAMGSAIVVISIWNLFR